MTLHYLCDLTAEQITGETGLSASTVKTHLIRGKDRTRHSPAGTARCGGPRRLSPHDPLRSPFREAAESEPARANSAPAAYIAERGDRLHRRRLAALAAAACLVLAGGGAA